MGVEEDFIARMILDGDARAALGVVELDRVARTGGDTLEVVLHQVARSLVLAVSQGPGHIGLLGHALEELHQHLVADLGNPEVAAVGSALLGGAEVGAQDAQEGREHVPVLPEELHPYPSQAFGVVVVGNHGQLGLGLGPLGMLQGQHGRIGGDGLEGILVTPFGVQVMDGLQDAVASGGFVLEELLGGQGELQIDDGSGVQEVVSAFPFQKAEVGALSLQATLSGSFPDLGEGQGHEAFLLEELSGLAQGEACEVADAFERERRLESGKAVGSGIVSETAERKGLDAHVQTEFVAVPSVDQGDGLAVLGLSEEQLPAVEEEPLAQVGGQAFEEGVVAFAELAGVLDASAAGGFDFDLALDGLEGGAELVDDVGKALPIEALQVGLAVEQEVGGVSLQDELSVVALALSQGQGSDDAFEEVFAAVAVGLFEGDVEDFADQVAAVFGVVGPGLFEDVVVKDEGELVKLIVVLFDLEVVEEGQGVFAQRDLGFYVGKDLERCRGGIRYRNRHSDE